MTKKQIAAIEKKVGQVWDWSITPGEVTARYEIVSLTDNNTPVMKMISGKLKPIPFSYSRWETDASCWSLETLEPEKVAPTKSIAPETIVI